MYIICGNLLTILILKNFTAKIWTHWKCHLQNLVWEKILRITFSNLFFVWIQFSLKFVSKDPINNNPVLLHILALHRTGDKPFAPKMLHFTDACMFQLNQPGKVNQWFAWHHLVSISHSVYLEWVSSFEGNWKAFVLLGETWKMLCVLQTFNLQKALLSWWTSWDDRLWEKSYLKPSNYNWFM